MKLLFRSFGVEFEVSVPDELLAGQLKDRLEKVFGPDLAMVGRVDDPVRLEISLTGASSFTVYNGGEESTTVSGRPEFIRVFESMVRIRVAELAPDHVFLHAGAVAVNGLALILPGKTRSGKTTLVGELVRNGAVYYSDEYAVLDTDGNVLPFSRPLSVRSGSSGSRRTDVTAEQLGGSSGDSPVPCGMVFFTRFAPEEIWLPRDLSPAAGMLELLENAVGIRHDPDKTLKVLNKLALRAIIAKSFREEASHSAIKLLKYFDRRTFGRQIY